MTAVARVVTRLTAALVRSDPIAARVPTTIVCGCISATVSGVMTIELTLGRPRMSVVSTQLVLSQYMRADGMRRSRESAPVTHPPPIRVVMVVSEPACAMAAMEPITDMSSRLTRVVMKAYLQTVARSHCI